MSTNESANHQAQSPDAKGHHPRVFKVHIDKQLLETMNPTPTGLELLTLAGKNPANQFALYEKDKGGPPKRIALDQTVDLREPGKERFVTLPLDQTEGLGSRRQFALSAEDMEWLDGCGCKYELVAEGELLARLHPYRLDPNGDFAVHRISLSHGIYEHENDGESCPTLLRHVGRGDVEPLLDWAELSAVSKAA